MTVTMQAAPGNWRAIPDHTDLGDDQCFATWFRVLPGDEGEEVHDEVRIASLPSWDHFAVTTHVAPARAKKSIERGSNRTTRRVGQQQFESLDAAIDYAFEYMRAAGEEN